MKCSFSSGVTTVTAGRAPLDVNMKPYAPSFATIAFPLSSAPSTPSKYVRLNTKPPVPSLPVLWLNTGFIVYFVPLFVAMSAPAGYSFTAPSSAFPFPSHSTAYTFMPAASGMLSSPVFTSIASSPPFVIEFFPLLKFSSPPLSPSRPPLITLNVGLLSGFRLKLPPLFTFSLSIALIPSALRSPLSFQVPLFILYSSVILYWLSTLVAISS